MKKRRTNTIELGLAGDDYLRALELKRKLKARSWDEFFLKLLDSCEASEPRVASLTRQITAEVPSREEMVEYLEGLMNSIDQTPLQEILDEEQAAKVAHGKRVIKVLLEMLKGDEATVQQAKR